jgi:N-acetylglutamate synthase-like GNAT family acetyltransferase
MHIRKAGKKELPSIVALARRLGLDYEGMEKDAFWAAEADGQVVGIVGLKRHADCLELCALGVDPEFRGQGIAKSLVEALAAGTPGDLHLATIIPSFFEARGFVKTEGSPGTFSEKRQTVWCEGCDIRLCTVMMRRRP